MTSFIYDVLKDLKHHHKDLSQLTFVLPSKRAGVFLKKEWSKLNTTTGFLPEILSIESFVEELSQLKPLSPTELLFELYSSYLKIVPKKEADPFDKFSKWAPTILQDFNEIDRYLIPQQAIFNYLSEIQELNHWSVEPNPTPLIKGYLSFWKKINHFYTEFTQQLLANQQGYQGLIYREAIENIESFSQNTPRQHLVFLGFNALNSSETLIIQELLQQEKASIYWDIDRVFMDNPYHDAGFFMRKHKTQWTYFDRHPFKWTSDLYSQPKHLHIIGTPKHVGQAKEVGQLLKRLHAKTGLKSTALVLANEGLLTPVLNALPKEVEAINITMGLPLSQIPFSTFINQWFKLQQEAGDKYYHLDVMELLSHPFVRPLFITPKKDISQTINQTINQNNLIYVSQQQLLELAPDHKDLVKLIFMPWRNDTSKAIANVCELIFKLKAYYSVHKNHHLLELEYLFRFFEIFNTLDRLNQQYSYIDNLKTLQRLFQDLLGLETLDFRGEPLEGLQIMGMLESRVLDFETVIIVSVNEGILPAGKTSNSFIPFDVKIQNGLPTYKEKDAIYTYHFYRLLQRAKEAYLIYNTEPDVLKGGEKSRFITQLEVDNLHHIQHELVVPKVPNITLNPSKVSKTPVIMAQLEVIAQSGFSPSSLTQYIRNPIDFYNQKLLGVRANDDFEETIAANTFGNVVHNTLELLYQPLEGAILRAENLRAMARKVESTVHYFFKEAYKQGDMSSGKNLISFEIAKRYVSNFLDYELQRLKAGDSIKIIALEAELSTEIIIEELSFPVVLRGVVDRIEECNGTLRIIDYKTGRVDQNQVEIVHWENLITDYKAYSKSFQLLAYAYMLHQQEAITSGLEAGIISFKNLKQGLLRFAKKDRLGAHASKTYQIDSLTMIHFEKTLKQLILELFDPSVDFIEKDV